MADRPRRPRRRQGDGPRRMATSRSVFLSRTSGRLGKCAARRAPRFRSFSQSASHLADRSPRASIFSPAQKPRPDAPNRGFDRHDRGKTEKLPARQVLEKIKQLAVPGDDPHLGRNRSILQGMSVNHGHTGIIFDSPARPPGRATEGDFLVIEEKILVHTTHARQSSPN